jgi:hypothetical protein
MCRTAVLLRAAMLTVLAKRQSATDQYQGTGQGRANF